VLRPLAESGWTVFVSIAPMLRRVTLPADFLRLGKWVICSGEQAPNRYVRRMDTRWARALHAQCAQANVSFFMRRLWGQKPIPPDLHVRQLPRPLTIRPMESVGDPSGRCQDNYAAGPLLCRPAPLQA
jgi:Protein of unknown function (DUF5131)